MTTAPALPNDEPQPPQLQPNHMMLMMLEINRIVVVYLLTYISQSADYLRVRSTTVPSVACQTTEGEYLLLTISYLLIPCSYLQVYTNITVACQTTEVTYS